MHWLANRTTKYIEDRAYCALGIFDVYLDTRYWEGEDEFFRLQEETLKTRTKGRPFDESVFAWRADQIEWMECLVLRQAGLQISEMSSTSNRWLDTAHSANSKTSGSMPHDISSWQCRGMSLDYRR